MIAQTSAQIYLSAQRGSRQSPHRISYRTLNYGSYRAEGREPIGKIRAFNEEFLAPGHRLLLTPDESTELILIPLAGGLEYLVDLKKGKFANSGETVRIGGASQIEIVNPFQTETINFIQIWLTTEIDTAFSEATLLNISAVNRLESLFCSEDKKCVGFLGEYEGRREGKYKTLSEDNHLFAFVVSGVFEVNNRLLHARDALTIFQPGEIEFESLAPDSLLFLLETTPN